VLEWRRQSAHRTRAQVLVWALYGIQGCLPAWVQSDVSGTATFWRSTSSEGGSRGRAQRDTGIENRTRPDRNEGTRLERLGWATYELYRGLRAE